MKKMLQNNIFSYLENNHKIGGKAEKLINLDKVTGKVPKWIVIASDVLTKKLEQNDSIDEIEEDKLIIDSINNYFGDETMFFAVRSSAEGEDGGKFSFAGQFESYLFIKKEDLWDKIKDVWSSAFSQRVIDYKEKMNIETEVKISVIIQKMVDAEVSGVAFGQNPISGKDEIIVSAVYGLGEGLVSGMLNSDNFTYDGKKITSQIIDKKFALKNINGKLQKTEINKDLRLNSTLSKTKIKEIASILGKLESEFGSAQDIEFAYKNDELFLLQTRPITSLKVQKNKIVWDNSNIVESYPGITTPLTFSFINKMYEAVYTQLGGLMGVNKKVLKENKSVFENTLGFIRGRVYYNLRSWYQMLAMVPGYSINAQYMETMMGVKEKFDLEDDYKMSRGYAWFRIILMGFRMIWLQIRLPNETKWFLKEFNKTIEKFKSIDYTKLSLKELIDYYKEFETTLLKKWKAPLINDFMAMIWFGILAKSTKKKKISDNPNIHNDLLVGSSDIISTEPIHLGLRIADSIREDEIALNLFLENDSDIIWAQIEAGSFPKIKNQIDDYIDKFGERCIGELKLETISFGQDPTLLIDIIKSYIEHDVSAKSMSSKFDNTIRENAINEVEKVYKGQFFQKKWFYFVLKMARTLVSNRENLRYERTRGFGMVRNIFSHIGEKMKKEGIIDNNRDIFYLKLNEIESIIDKNLTKDIKSLITKRKNEFKEYYNQKPPVERFYTYGFDFSDNYIYSKEKLEKFEGDLKGVGACPGVVEAEANVIIDPKSVKSLKGNILITNSTDPGWVTLFPTASGIIVERGSLLSHSAIVAREMGIPCIVGVTGLLQKVKTGDKILMNGSTGQLKIIS